MQLSRLIPIVVIVVIFFITITIWIFPNTGDFRSENPFWNGLEALSSEFKVKPLQSLSELPVVSEETLLIVIPYLQPTPDEVRHIKAYVNTGGILLLADDFGFGNIILKELDLDVSFHHAPLLDPLINFRDQWLPLVTQFTISPLTDGVSTLALNYATILQGSNITVVAKSSPFSFLDINNDGIRGAQEPLGPFPIIGYTSLGQGQIVVVSDPSIFIKSMLYEVDNALFTRNLINISGQNPTIFLDESHLSTLQLEKSKKILRSIRRTIANSNILTLTTMIVIILITAPLWRQKGGSR